MNLWRKHFYLNLVWRNWRHQRYCFPELIQNPCLRLDPMPNHTTGRTMAWSDSLFKSVPLSAGMVETYEPRKDRSNEVVKEVPQWLWCQIPWLIRKSRGMGEDCLVWLRRACHRLKQLSPSLQNNTIWQSRVISTRYLLAFLVHNRASCLYSVCTQTDWRIEISSCSITSGSNFHKPHWTSPQIIKPFAVWF